MIQSNTSRQEFIKHINEFMANHVDYHEASMIISFFNEWEEEMTEKQDAINRLEESETDIAEVIERFEEIIEGLDAKIETLKETIKEIHELTQTTEDTE